jgi:hypothetical protein
LLLFLGLPAFGLDLAPIPEHLVVRECGKGSPTLTYAVERVITELHTLYGFQASGETNAANPFGTASDGSGVVVLGRPSDSMALGQWCREQGLNPATVAPGPDGYQIIVQAKPWRVVIVADTDVGVWYGACGWLDSLREAADKTVSTPVGVFQDAPALSIRFTRGLGAREHSSRLEDAISSLDWWARWRMNVTHAPSLPEPQLKEFLAEAHKRGIRVVRGIGVRNLCATDDRAVAKCADEFRRFLELGGDGVSGLWDDLPHARCAGHCDRCRERFGTNSLPHEIVHILEALCDVAAESPGHPLILWCPPHYSEHRYKELSDEAFFKVIGSSPKVCRQTQMYYCEFAPEKTALLDQLGITNRVWWYNGLRTVYHVCHNWPAPNQVKISIPGLKSFGAPDFARFEVGWKTGVAVAPGGVVLPVPERTWQALRTLPARYDGYYPCTANNPYHCAISGCFAFNPREFEQADADRAVFRAIFGPGSAKPARAWSDAYVQFQVRLAQMPATPLTQEQMADEERRMTQWRAGAREVQSCAAQDHSLLSTATLESVLARMREAEDSVQKVLAHHNASAQPGNHEPRQTQTEGGL